MIWWPSSSSIFCFCNQNKITWLKHFHRQTFPDFSRQKAVCWEPSPDALPNLTLKPHYLSHSTLSIHPNPDILAHQTTSRGNKLHVVDFYNLSHSIFNPSFHNLHCLLQQLHAPCMCHMSVHHPHLCRHSLSNSNSSPRGLYHPSPQHYTHQSSTMYQFSLQPWASLTQLP